MNPVYLNDWREGGFIQLVADFEDIFMTAEEYEAAECPWRNVQMWEENKSKLAKALSSPEWVCIEVLLASYSYENYSGSAFVLFRRDGKLYEVNASHCSCSCYGVEGQWHPEETTKDALMIRLDKGTLGGDDYCGNEFAAELREVLASLTPNPKERRAMAEKALKDGKWCAADPVRATWFDRFIFFTYRLRLIFFTRKARTK